MKAWTSISIVAMGLGLTLAGCGTKENNRQALTETYTYRFNEHYQYGQFKCTTGDQTFTSKTAYCQGLTSFALNNGDVSRGYGSCAFDQRKARYESQCGAAFEETDFPWTKLYSASQPGRGGCETGGDVHAATIYPTRAQFCDMLQDRAFHNDCALDYRRYIFTHIVQCPTFFEDRG